MRPVDRVVSTGKNEADETWPKGELKVAWLYDVPAYRVVFAY